MDKVKEEKILDNTNVTVNSEQIAILKKYFPNCFDKKGDFLIDKLSEIVTRNGLNASHEGYKLDWLGKSYARLLANEKPRTFITGNLDHNNKAENQDSKNLLIKGDNLEVLKHLKNAYTEAVKVIYIDPPYNTGSDGFVYKDDRKFTKEELANLANVSEEDAERILSYTDKGSNSHSAWLTFIYPRLYVARELLKEDGVIFISIDDNEQAQLKLLCDEVFGEENFVAELIWKRKKQPSFLATHIAKVTENLLVYSKDKSKLEKISIDTISDSTKKVINNTNAISERTFNKGVLVKSINNGVIPRGIYTIKTMSVEYLDDIEVRNGITTNIVRVKSQFSVSQEKIESFINQKLLFITENNGLRRYVSEEEQNKRKSITDLLLDWGDNQDSEKEIIDLFSSRVFDFTKPVLLVSNIIRSVFSENSLILDFFAGSGTTAHAVMDLNSDGGNRQYILVQLPEETDKKSEAYKADYNTIFDITKARIEKAAEKIKAEKPDYEGDLGFKIFETQDLPQNYNAEIDKLSTETQMELWDGSNADDELLRAILTTWTLYDGILLTTDLQIIELSNSYKTYYGVGKSTNTLYLMHKGFETDNIKDIIDKLDNDRTFTPEKIVLYGHNFDSKSQRELSEALSNYNNKKDIKINIIKRY